MQKYSLEIIGTHLTISVDTKRDMGGVFHDIETYLQAFESKYSRFIPGNWLHDLNISRRAMLDQEGKDMLLCMLELARRSSGYFDPTIGKRLTELGYGNKTIHGKESISVRSKEGLIQAQENGNYTDIEIIGDEVILHNEVELEFGGVGKGYLIDRIRSIMMSSLSYMEDHEHPRYLIDFSGDLYGIGGWKVGLESPISFDEVIGTIALDDAYLACSSGSRRKWGEYHHLLDPHTGESAREVIASYIETSGDHSSGGMLTDSYATALCVMPWSLARETLEKTPIISGSIVRHDGVIYQKVHSKGELFT